VAAARSSPSQRDLVAAVEACACFQLRKASRAVTQLYDAALQPTGLRSTQFVLLAVARIEEPVSLPRLALALGVDRSTLSRNLGPLEADGLVRCARKAGRGGTTVRLSARGVRKLAAAVPYWARVQQAFTDGFGPDRWDALRQRLSEAVDAARRT